VTGGGQAKHTQKGQGAVHLHLAYVVIGYCWAMSHRAVPESGHEHICAGTGASFVLYKECHDGSAGLLQVKVGIELHTRQPIHLSSELVVKACSILA
jgi:hypothetical protein